MPKLALFDAVARPQRKSASSRTAVCTGPWGGRRVAGLCPIRQPQSRHRLGAPLRAIGFVLHACLPDFKLETSNVTLVCELASFCTIRSGQLGLFVQPARAGPDGGPQGAPHRTSMPNPQSAIEELGSFCTIGQGPETAGLCPIRNRRIGFVCTTGPHSPRRQAAEQASRRKSVLNPESGNWVRFA
jgi:hypothetical protein